MSSALKKIADEVLKLPARSRARLAQRLLASLEEAADPEAENAWRAEVEKRSSELMRGDVKGIPANRVFKKARTALR
jgi:putative addiction module component (TIGR02574 family)